MSENATNLLDRSVFEPTPDDEIKIPVLNFKTQEPLGAMFFKPVSMSVLEEYRGIRNGTGRGRRKPDPQRANAHLFRKAFVRFEPKDSSAQLALKEGQSQVDFFISECPMLVDRIIIEYHNLTYPDIDESGK